MKSPVIVSFTPPLTSTPPAAKASIARPLTVTLGAFRVRPTAVAPAPVPSSAIRGVVPVPGSVVPSRSTAWVTVGRAVLGLMVWSPDPIANRIVLTAVPPVAFELRMAWRRLPAPVSLTLVTVNVASSCRPSSDSTRGRRPRACGRRDSGARRRDENQREAIGVFLGRGGPRAGARPGRPPPERRTVAARPPWIREIGATGRRRFWVGQPVNRVASAGTLPVAAAVRHAEDRFA